MRITGAVRCVNPKAARRTEPASPADVKLPFAKLGDRAGSSRYAGALSLPRHAWSFRFLLLLILMFIAGKRAYGQETVFDVPSADILDSGRIYGELDGTVRPVDRVATFTPRVVLGMGLKWE